MLFRATEGDVAWRAAAVILVVAASMAVLSLPASATDNRHLDVEILDTNSPVEPGEPLTFTVQVENWGSEGGREDIKLLQGKLELDKVRVATTSEWSDRIQLTWNTTDGDQGTHRIAVASNDARNVTNVTVLTTNEAPTASVNITHIEGLRYTFNATVNDSDGNVTATRWSVDDEFVASGTAVEHKFPRPGEFDVGFTVTDDDEANTSTEQGITVEGLTPELDPSITVRTADGKPFDETRVDTGTQLNFTAEASIPRGYTVEYRWRVDGSEVGVSSKTAYAFQTPGRHTMNLSVALAEDAVFHDEVSFMAEGPAVGNQSTVTADEETDQSENETTATATDDGSTDDTVGSSVGTDGGAGGGSSGGLPGGDLLLPGVAVAAMVLAALLMGYWLGGRGQSRGRGRQRRRR